jgi:hypothetical protein
MWLHAREDRRQDRSDGAYWMEREDTVGTKDCKGESKVEDVASITQLSMSECKAV